MQLAEFTGPDGSPLFINPRSINAIYLDPTFKTRDGQRMTCIELRSGTPIFVQEDVETVRNAIDSIGQE